MRGNWQLLGGDCRAVLATLDPDSVDACVSDPPYELGFMGRAWDRSGVAFDVETWRAVWRVLKPGAHLLAFGGTRTVHRMTCAIEDAGFDIRDSLVWLYGSGFPKSLDVSKAIDAAAGAVREIVGKRDRYLDGHERQNLGDRNQIFGDGLTANGVADVTAPATDAAKQWAGFGTALKPAHEPIVLARKPLIVTVAANVLAHGTGALNIDACRIGSVDKLVRPQGQPVNCMGARTPGAGRIDEPAGRWPANVLLDEEAARLLDEQSGERATHGGGASRFFYVPKPARRERDAGLEHMPARTGGEATDRKDGSDGLNSPRAGAGRKGGSRNFHPTVKPVELMAYLVRLVTPPGGLVLDPFAGSGTTGIAALREGARFVGIDLDPEYARLAMARIEEDAPLFNRGK